MKGRWALLMIASAVFVALRLTFNREYEGASWEALVDGTAPLPFGHRVLVPWLVRPAVDAGSSIRTAFGTVEWASTMAALVGVERALHHFVSRRIAQLGAGVFLVVLGLAFLLPLPWPIFYPWDMPAIACIAWGVALAQDRRHGALVVLATFGAANRESAILLPFITLALLAGTEHQREAIRSASLQLVAVVMVRLVVSVMHPIAKGGVVDLRVDHMWRIDHNLEWLGDPVQALVTLGSFSLLPVLWLWLRSWIPLALRRLELVVLPAMAGLMVVANIYESRAWGEPLMLLYLGVVVGAARWADEAQSSEPSGAIERWAGPAAFGALVVALLVRVLLA